MEGRFGLTATSLACGKSGRCRSRGFAREPVAMESADAAAALVDPHALAGHAVSALVVHPYRAVPPVSILPASARVSFAYVFACH